MLRLFLLATLLFSKIAYSFDYYKHITSYEPFKELMPAVNDDDLYNYKTIILMQNMGIYDFLQTIEERIGNKNYFDFVLYNRYLKGKNWNSSEEELLNFLAKYANFYLKQDIENLLKKKYFSAWQNYHKNKKSPNSNTQPYWQEVTLRLSYYSTAENWYYLSGDSIPNNLPKDLANINKLMQNGNIDEALTLLNKLDYKNDTTHNLENFYAKIMRHYLNIGNDDKVIEIFQNMPTDYFQKNAAANWYLMLAYWRKKHYGNVQETLKDMIVIATLNNEYKAACYYWLARSHLMQFDMENWRISLQRAAEYKNSFYGIIARQNLATAKLDSQSLQEIDNNLLQYLNKPENQQIVFLMQLGNSELLQEFLSLRLQKVEEKEFFLLLRLMAVLGLNEELYKKLYVLFLANPRQSLANYMPESIVDMNDEISTSYKNLMLAITQQESAFVDSSVSHVGAKGLMQLTEQTKEMLINKYNLADDFDLLNKSNNLELGSLYINHLLSDKPFNQDLTYMLAAWNAGPNRAKRWYHEDWRDIDNDSLFWIEALPVAETRDFIKLVLRNFWLYQAKGNQELIGANNLISGTKIYLNKGN